MTEEQRIRNLNVPRGKADVVLDTDAFNEIDDQYAIAYLLRSKEKLCTKAIYAAPFLKEKVNSAAEGTEKSYNEIINILKLLKEKCPVFRGAERFLADENTPVISDAARDMAVRVNDYSPQNPLYIVAIGAITNVASALLLNPKLKENAVVVWLGGHTRHYHDSVEFNMRQDVAAARTVIKSGVPFVQLPCKGVVSAFTLSKPEISCWLQGKNELCDYLTSITIREMERRTKDEIWTKPIWDVTAVAWLLNENERFMLSRLVRAPLPSYDHYYTAWPNGHLMQYVYFLNKDELLKDLIEKLTR